MNSNQNSNDEAWKRIQKLQTLTIATSKTGESSNPSVKQDTSKKQQIETLPSSSSVKCNDLSKIMSVQSHLSSLRMNQETQTNNVDFEINNKAKLCRNCCFGSLPEKSNVSHSEQRGTSDEKLKEWSFQQALMDMQVSYTHCTFIKLCM